VEPAETPYLRGPGYPEHYRDRRFATGTGARTHRRESRALDRLLALIPEEAGPWLDMPAGTGRFAELLPGPVVQVDRNHAMLAAGASNRPRVCAAGSCLPFPADTFAGALCLRLMHHLPSGTERTLILAELHRVSRGPILVSYFDSLSLQHLRRVLGRTLGRHRSGRCAIPWRRFRGELRQAGLEPEAKVHLWPLFSEQCLVLALPR
jgi:hypothetical protein